MGLIRAAAGAIGGTLGDQWLDSVVPAKMTPETLMCKGAVQGKTKHNTGVITDGSKVQVPEKQFMILVDGGKIIDYTAEPGYYEVNNSTAPSLLNGDFRDALGDAFNRFKFGGTTPLKQEVFYVNTQEVQNIAFGTQNPINYFDNFYNAELFLRSYGYYSVRITNPLTFYAEMGSRTGDGYVGIEELHKLFLAEFLTAYQTAIGQLSAEGVRISFLTQKTTELAAKMGEILSKDWEERRGIRIVSVGISSLSYDDTSRDLINMRNQGAMLSDPNIRTGYVQGATAKGIESAGANTSGAGNAFMGVNMGMNAAGGFVGEATRLNNEQAAAQQPMPQPAQNNSIPTAGSWTCPTCDTANTGNFCSNCGATKPQMIECSNCHTQNAVGSKFCSNCGQKLN